MRTWSVGQAQFTLASYKERGGSVSGVYVCWLLLQYRTIQNKEPTEKSRYRTLEVHKVVDETLNEHKSLNVTLTVHKQQ